MKKVWKKTAVTVTVAAAALALYGCAGSSDTEKQAQRLQTKRQRRQS